MNEKGSPKLTDTLHALEEAIGDIPLTELPSLLGTLERAKALGWSRMLTGPAPTECGNTDLLTMAETAKRLRIPESRAYELARQQKLPAVRIGKYVRVSVQALAEYQARLPKA